MSKSNPTTISTDCICMSWTGVYACSGVFHNTTSMLVIQPILSLHAKLNYYLYSLQYFFFTLKLWWIFVSKLVIISSIHLIFFQLNSTIFLDYFWKSLIMQTPVSFECRNNRLIIIRRLTITKLSGMPMVDQKCEPLSFVGVFNKI